MLQKVLVNYKDHKKMKREYEQGKNKTEWRLKANAISFISHTVNEKDIIS